MDITTTTHPLPPHSSPNFPQFSLLPLEIRLQIWSLTLQPRVLEVQLRNLRLQDHLIYTDSRPPASSSSSSSSSDDEEESSLLLSVPPKRPPPLTAPPTLPAAFHTTHESRTHALSLYRPLIAPTFISPYSNPNHWPHNLFHPTLDTLYFPLSLYSMQTTQPGPPVQEVMFSSTAAAKLGMKREFILDRLSGGCSFSPSSSSSLASSRSRSSPSSPLIPLITHLAISWSDMHIQDVTTLYEALQPFTSLQSLYLVFFEQKADRLETRWMGGKQGRFSVSLVEPEEVVVRGRFLERVLEVHVVLAEELTRGLRELEGVGDGRRRVGWRAPVVGVRMARFVE